MTASTLASMPVGKAAEPHPPGQWGMLLLIVTEASLFAYLLFSYFYLAARSATPWPPGGPPELTIALPNTGLLLASSVALWWAERNLDRGQLQRSWLGLTATIILGASFLALQGVEYSKQTFTPASHAYGSVFFIVTGLHGTHVLVGLFVLGFVLAMALRGQLDRTHRHYLHNAALYWHFVDAVWIAVFTSLYLSPRFGL